MIHSGRVAALDGMRGLAIALVLFAHVFGFTGAGLVGVLMFFVLSGYVITAVITTEVSMLGTLNLRAFYLRRALRLLPALILVIVMVVVLSLQPGSGVDPAQTRAGVWQGLLYVTDFAVGLGYTFSPELEHLWTLAVEEHFYILWPLVAVWILRRPVEQRLRLMAWLIAAAVVLRLVTVLAGISNGWFFYVLPTIWIECLLAGCTLAIVRTSRATPAGRDSPPREKRLTASATAASVLTLLGFSLHPQTFLHPLTYVLGIPALALASLWVTRLASEPRPSMVRSLLARQPLRWLGDRSYAIYLFNSPCIMLATNLLGGSVWTRSMGAAVAIVLSIASRRLVEQPALSLKRRLS